LTQGSTERSGNGKADFDILHEARQLAVAGDRWLVSLADGLERVTAWAHREAEIVSESAKAAYATTRDFTRTIKDQATGGSDMSLLLRRFGHMMASNADDEYDDLQSNGKFWKLLRTLRRHPGRRTAQVIETSGVETDLQQAEKTNAFT